MKTVGVTLTAMICKTQTEIEPLDQEKLRQNWLSLDLKVWWLWMALDAAVAHIRSLTTTLGKHFLTSDYKHAHDSLPWMLLQFLHQR